MGSGDCGCTTEMGESNAPLSLMLVPIGTDASLSSVIAADAAAASLEDVFPDADLTAWALLRWICGLCVSMLGGNGTVVEECMTLEVVRCGKDGRIGIVGVGWST